MVTVGRWRSGICWLLTLQLLIPAPSARAAASDGSTLAADRGAVPAASESAASVDPGSGAAQWELPLALPEGTGGMTPQIALRYSSARRADSWVGFGWTLGLSSLARSLARGIPSYDDARDEFELDGQRLVSSGSEPGRWHTRRESFLRILREADGSWTVTRKDGMRLRYGTSEEARIRNRDGAVFQWLLSEQEDTRGNAFSVRYDRRDPGTAYPMELRYTLRRGASGALASLDGDPGRDRVVSFVLEPRPDTPRSHAAGFERRLGHRLQRIDVRAGGALLRRYALRYAASPDSFRSLLVEIALHGADADAPAPTPPQVTSFGYRSNVATNRTGWAPAAWSWPAGLALVRSDRRDGGVRLADVDGDGRPDLVKAYGVQSGADFVASADSGVHLNLGNGFAATRSPDFTLPAFTGQGGNRLTLAFAWEFSSSLVWGNGTTPIDLTGDGRADFVGAIGGIQPYPFVGALFQSYQGSWCRSAPGSPGGFLCLEAAELYGDGALYTGKQGALQSGFTTTPALFGGNTRFGDLDGDGLADLVVRGRELLYELADSSVCAYATSYSYAVYNRGALRFEGAPLDPAGAPRPGCAGHRSRISRDFQPCRLGTDADCELALFQNVSQLTGSEVFGWVWEAHPEYGNLLLDLNGDGLADHASATRLGATSLLRAWLNDGARGFRAAHEFSLPVPLQEVMGSAPGYAGQSKDLGVRLADVNGDGRVDVVQALPGGVRTTWLHDGDADESEGPWVTSAAWATPPTLGLEFVNTLGQDMGVRLEDVDGDGMTDLVQSIGNTRQVYLNRGEVPDLLERITTPLGGTTAFEYTPSTSFDHRGGDGVPDLPQVLQLVTAIVVDDADPVTPVSRTTQSYEGGVYDAAARELRGFRKVTRWAPDGRSIVSYFHQDEARAGLAERVERRDAAGALWHVTETSWTPDDDGTAPFVSLLASETRLEYDGQSAPRRSRTDFQYDAGGPPRYGNLTARVDWGEVDAAGADLLPGDTRTSELEYAQNPALHLVDRVKRRVLRAGPPGSGALLSDTRFFYDGDSSGAAPPTRGLVTQRVAILARAGEADPTTRFEYDGYGNLTSAADPRAVAGQGGGVTRFEYDATWHSFRTAVVNALGHRLELRYASPPGCAPYPAGAGIVQEERGPNLLPGESGLRRCLDAFGRVVLERAPLDLADTSWSYADVPGAASVTRSERASAAGGRRSETAFLDGLGRAVRITRSGPQGRTVQWLRSYDTSGRLGSESAPHFVGESAQTTSYLHDPLDRLRQISLPGGGRTTSLSHVQGLEVRSDPSGRVLRRQRDVFGNVVRVEEVEGDRTHVTHYLHDALDRLVQIQDARGNLTQIGYDRLGRRRALLDPDASWSIYSYDANGNLTGRSDPAGSVSWSFDALDRPTLRRVDGVVETRFGYDGASRGKGLLHTRSDAAGSYRAAAYDALGRLVADAQTVEGQGFAFFTEYDPLGQLAARHYPGGRTLRWSRDASGHLTEIGSPGETPFAAGIEWDARGRLTRWSAGNGVTSTRLFTAATGRLDTLEVRSGSSVLEKLRYAYDAADRVVEIDDRRPGALPDRSFVYDALGRLAQATGPYRAGFLATTLRYAYDEIGNLLCLDATSLAGCVGGVAMTYPSVAGEARPHAPLAVAGVPAGYDTRGNLIELGTRAYGYDALGRLADAREAGRTLASFAYDAGGRRARAIDSSGPRSIVRELLRSDFEWDRTRGLARIHVGLAGSLVATSTEPLAPSFSAGPAGGARLGRDTARGLAAAPGALAALLLGLQLLRLRRRGAALARPALAGAAALLVYFDLVAPALALPDGDLNSDGRLDAADALIALRISRGSLAPTAQQLERGDVAPLEATPEAGPDRIHAGDVLLLLRALRGDDVDGDGLAAEDELAVGASPFRADSDGDGLADSFEAAFGTDPAAADSDGDGVPDGTELARGSDPTSGDTDADGIPDGSDPDPLAGVVYRHADHLGSSVLVTRADGGVLERAVYKPYGAAVPATSGGSPRAPELGFTGRRFEAALGLYDFGARFYDPRLGRFLQPDPVVPGADRPQALNRFAYAFGDPQGYTDPSGHWPTTEETWAGVSGFLDDYLLGPLSSFGRGFSEGFAGVWSAAGVSVASDIGFFRSAGQALGGLVATPFALARGNPFPDPQYRLGADPARAVSLEDTRAHVAGGIATHGILNDPSSATNLAERRLRESGVVLFNPSGGILNDLLESAVQLFAPGATDLDRALAALVPSAGRVPFAFGSSQGTLTVRNGLFLAALSGRRGVVEEAWFTGSPSNAAVSLVMAGAVGGAQLRNLVTWRDPVAALGQPWFTPVALGALATGNAIHPDESYQRHYGDF